MSLPADRHDAALALRDARIAELERETAKLREDQARFLWALDHPCEFEAAVSVLHWGPDAASNAALARQTIDRLRNA